MNVLFLLLFSINLGLGSNCNLIQFVMFFGASEQIFHSFFLYKSGCFSSLKHFKYTGNFVFVYFDNEVFFVFVFVFATALYKMKLLGASMSSNAFYLPNV